MWSIFVYVILNETRTLGICSFIFLWNIAKRTFTTRESGWSLTYSSTCGWDIVVQVSALYCSLCCWSLLELVAQLEHSHLINGRHIVSKPGVRLFPSYSSSNLACWGLWHCWMSDFPACWMLFLLKPQHLQLYMSSEPNATNEFGTSGREHGKRGQRIVWWAWC